MPAAAHDEFEHRPTHTAVERLEGEDVDAELTRANGCEIERFERFAAVLQALFPDYRPGAALKP